MDTLARDGWLARVRDGACRRTSEPRPPPPGEVIGILGDDVETTPSDCRATLDAIDRIAQVRRDASRAGDISSLEALRRATAELRPVANECPAEGASDVAILAAVVREIAEASVALDLVVGGAPGECAVATLGDPVRLTAAATRDGGAQVGMICRPASWTDVALECVGRSVFSVDPMLEEAPAAESAYVELMFSGTHALTWIGYVVVRDGSGWRVHEEIELGQACR